MPKKLNYAEGDCFVLPLEDRGYARGVVARLNGKGSVFGYFFGPRLLLAKDANTDGDFLSSSKAILVGRFGDLGFLKNEWKVIDRIEPWLREAWPMPPFVRSIAGTDFNYLSYYDENTFELIREEKAVLRSDYLSSLPKDNTMGYIAVQIVLTKRLNEFEKK